MPDRKNFNNVKVTPDEAIMFSFKREQQTIVEEGNNGQRKIIAGGTRYKATDASFATILNKITAGQLQERREAANAERIAKELGPML